MANKCLATTINGKPCKAWSVKTEPTCSLHTPRIKAKMELKKNLTPKTNFNPSKKQEKLANLIIDNKMNDLGKTQSQLIEEAGYSPSVAVQGSNVIKTKGVQSVLAKHGLSLDLAVNRHRDIIINADDKTALKAVDLVYEVEQLKSKQTSSTFFNILSVVNKETETE